MTAMRFGSEICLRNTIDLARFAEPANVGCFGICYVLAYIHK